MSPGRGSHVTDGKPDLSTLKISFPWETSGGRAATAPGRRVRGRVPRKQGLKHNLPLKGQTYYYCPRASSTKTRIETPMCPRRRLTRDGWKTGSIDIKIQFSMGNPSRRASCRSICGVRGRVPRKQGLKPGATLRRDTIIEVCGRVPRKQGLKRP